MASVNKCFPFDSAAVCQMSHIHLHFLLPFLVPLSPYVPQPSVPASSYRSRSPNLIRFRARTGFVDPNCQGLSLHQPLPREVSNLISPHLFHSIHPYSYICHKDLLTPELSDLATTVDSCLLSHLPFGALSASVRVCALASGSFGRSSIHSSRDFSIYVASG